IQFLQQDHVVDLFPDFVLPTSFDFSTSQVITYTGSNYVLQSNKVQILNEAEKISNGVSPLSLDELVPIVFSLFNKANNDVNNPLSTLDQDKNVEVPSVFVENLATIENVKAPHRSTQCSKPLSYLKDCHCSLLQSNPLNSSTSKFPA
ncbi:unnamed protein product, partial [Citrullus colocynthis]